MLRTMKVVNNSKIVGETMERKKVWEWLEKLRVGNNEKTTREQSKFFAYNKNNLYLLWLIERKIIIHLRNLRKN